MNATIEDADDLRLLRTRAVPDTARISLAGPLADSGLERTINHTYGACGCEAGSVFVVAAVIGCAAGILRYGADGLLGWWHVVGYVVAAALAGKLLGIGVARVRLRRAITELERRLVHVRADGLRSGGG
jgi:hypothetical protein